MYGNHMCLYVCIHTYIHHTDYIVYVYSVYVCMYVCMYVQPHNTLGRVVFGSLHDVFMYAHVCMYVCMYVVCMQHYIVV